MAHEDPQQQRELLAGAIGPDYRELEESFASAPGRGRESYVRLTRYAEYLRARRRPGTRSTRHPPAHPSTSSGPASEPW